jgi:phage terminase large subunit
MIYDEWDTKVHLVDHFLPPLNWTRFWTVDFGFTNPFVWQAWAYDQEDDRLYRFGEIYYTKTLVEDIATKIKTWQKVNDEPLPAAIICDHDAEGRATLERHLGMETEPADKQVLDGIQLVKTRMKLREDHKPGIIFMRDSLLEIDPDLSEVGRPCKTEDEFEGYEWLDNRRKEQPKKDDDHGMDATRYMCKYVEGEVGGWSMGMS